MGRTGQGGQASGAGGGFNQNWDGVWQVRTAISEIGWSAEFAIPFRTLRFPAGPAQTWGVNFQRNIRRRNETSYWAPLPRQFDLFRVSLAGQVNGIVAPEGLWRTLQLTPYVVGKAARRFGRAGGVRRHQYARWLRRRPEVRRDLRAGPWTDLQHGFRTGGGGRSADQPRPLQPLLPGEAIFLLENAGAFTVSNSGGAAFNDPGQTELFFSRRIGIGAAGEAIPILAGARLSGKVSESVTVGFLNMQTEAVGESAPANNFTVARLRRDLPNRSSFGGLLVNRQATGALAGSDNYNRTYAVDGRWGFGQNGLVSGFRLADADPRIRWPRPCLGHGGRLQHRGVATSRRLHGDGRELQPGSRLRPPDGVPEGRRGGVQYLAPRSEPAAHPGAAAARHVQPVLEHRQPVRRDLAPPYGQLHGVRGQLGRDHGLEYPGGGSDEQFPDLGPNRRSRIVPVARSEPEL